MSTKTQIIISWIAGIAILGGAIFWLIQDSKKPGKLDEFATCLGEKGATFYGAFWCPHCQKQKAVFGKSQKNLPYVECSTPDGKGQLEVCIEKKIEGYPTWIFADEERMSGEIALEKLAEKTSCELPE